MPLQNRVTPFSTLETAPERGTLMGNRGILHDADKRIGTSTWRHKRWLCCVTSFKDRKRELMVPGEYTALFFLDEAVALAAGHRPCKECRRSAYSDFALAWRRAGRTGDEATADGIDAALHRNRVTRDRRQVRHSCRLGDLPDGAFLAFPDEPTAAFLLWGGALRRWSHAGYGDLRSIDAEAEVEVITPSLTVDAIRAGYVPIVHPTANDPAT